MGTIGFPESVLRSMPLLVCTSNMGLRLLKKAGFPQPTHTHTLTPTSLDQHANFIA